MRTQWIPVCADIVNNGLCGECQFVWKLWILVCADTVQANLCRHCGFMATLWRMAWFSCQRRNYLGACLM